MNKLELSYFSEDEFRYKLQETIDRMSENKTPQIKPVAFLLGGQPGSGKTTLHKIINNKLNDNIITIDNDTFKYLHPKFDLLVEEYGKDYVSHVTPFSNRMTEALIEHFSNKSFNLSIEGTLRTTDIPKTTATFLKGKGYEVNLYVMAVSKRLSYLSTLERYESMYLIEPRTARATDKTIHDKIVSNLPDNLETLFKSNFFADISIFTRDGTKIYSSVETPFDNPKQIFQDILNQSVSKKILIDKVEYLITLTKQNNHSVNHLLAWRKRHILSHFFRVTVHKKRDPLR
ncbi:toxin zeta [Bacillus wiedmannii]|uniref:zeta toxin family protein n=1 Tax=Bacillus wiedmannii TaxID=1890302 RepID=UPI000BFC13F6|nr:zeta toxin family protein [Bacillus wiedmannii]PHE69829.1 toxin zeta [Bacillus wiedmannii]